MNKKITLGFSPCPNDTYIFCAMVNGMIDCGGLQFEPVIEDVEKLNQKALAGELDITKLSMSAYAFTSENYMMLNAGSALGRNCGPLLVSEKEYAIDEINDLKIAIPGKYTTANLLLSTFFPDAFNKQEMIFSEIENAVLNKSVDAGLIIHESRFTYRQKGLLKIADMGEVWEEKTGCLLPLGCIAVKRSMDSSLKKQIDEIIKQSIFFAQKNPEQVMNYVRSHAQETDEKVMRQHIQLYVNEFSLALGAQGKKAIELLLKKGNEAALLPAVSEQVFIS